jgi:hypothetical protein
MSTSEFEGRAALDGFPATWRRVMTEPHAFFADMPETGGLAQPLAFVAICAAINGAGHVIRGWGVHGLVWVIVWQIIGAVVSGAVFVLVAQHLFQGRAGFEPTFRVVAYASAPTVFAWLPMVGAVFVLWAIYLAVVGLERVHAFDTTRAVLTVVIGYAAVWLLLVSRRRHPLHWP